MRDNDTEHASLEHASLSPQPSVVRFALSLASYSSSSRSSDLIDGLERNYGRRSFLLPSAMAITGDNSRGSLPQPPQFTPQQLQHLAAAAEAHRRANPPPPVPMAGRPTEEFRDPLAIEAARVTPGVDDTPYIQYAIEALTREREGESSMHPSSMASEGQPLVENNNGGRDNRARRQTPMSPLPVSKLRDVSSQNEEQSAPLLSETGTGQRRPSSHRSSLSTLVKGKEKATAFPPRQPPPEAWEPVEPEHLRDGREKINPRLAFKPKILRTASKAVLMFLVVLMIVALIFSAVYSRQHDGLWDYVGSIYSGQYFLFRVVPAILGAVILIYAQCTVVTMLRMRPFARLAAASKESRRDAIFDEMYPTSFLRPQLIGTWRIWVPNLITWLMNFTLPLQSCLFTVIYVDGRWRWATVQGVVWTLVAFYLLLFIAIGIELSYWLIGKTGVMWDPRSIADMAALIANSNTLPDYRHTELLGRRDQLKRVLYRRRTDRLTYWGWADRERADDLWYGIGHQEEWGNPISEFETMDEKGRPQSHETRTYPKHTEDADPWGDVELEGTAMHPRVRYRHLPFCLKDCPLICCIILGFFLLVALFVVSFIPQTRLLAGFLPLLSAAPIQGAFSAADFLYSFLPALLGLFLYVAFQDLDLHLRILQPWGELSSPPAGGAMPEASVLADYAACYPLQASWRALRNRHWRVAIVSLLSLLFVFLPIFAGGMFLALTPEDSIVRVYPQVPLFALVLALVVMYWLALVSLFPRRQAFRLPHGVTCLAEVFSFVSNDDCVHDEAFQGMIRNKTTLIGKLGVNRRDQDKPRWTLHTGGRGAEDERLGLRRVKKFTERAVSGPSDGPSSRLMGGYRSVSGGTGATTAQRSSLGTGTVLQDRREARRSEREGVRISPQFVFQGRES